MKEKFRDIRFSAKSLVMIKTINEILDEYTAKDYRLTLRQVYYQLVARKFIPNIVSEYKKLSSLLTNARMNGLVDFDAIEDRLRTPRTPFACSNLSEGLWSLYRGYNRRRMENQEIYIEVWIEKDSLSSIAYAETKEYGIPLVVNRGYSSCSAMREAARRFAAAEKKGKKISILYLGDHDPSGLDMIRDIYKRLEEFCVYIEIIHVALSMDQIQEYDLPPDPAKLTDPRAQNYIYRFGNESWELDALKPEILSQIIKNEILDRIDKHLYETIIEAEKDDLKRLMEMIEDS